MRDRETETDRDKRKGESEDRRKCSCDSPPGFDHLKSQAVDKSYSKFCATHAGAVGVGDAIVAEFYQINFNDYEEFPDQPPPGWLRLTVRPSELLFF